MNILPKEEGLWQGVGRVTKRTVTNTLKPRRVPQSYIIISTRNLSQRICILLYRAHIRLEIAYTDLHFTYIHDNDI